MTAGGILVKKYSILDKCFLFQCKICKNFYKINDYYKPIRACKKCMEPYEVRSYEIKFT